MHEPSCHEKITGKIFGRNGKETSKKRAFNEYDNNINKYTNVIKNKRNNMNEKVFLYKPKKYAENKKS